MYTGLKHLHSTFAYLVLITLAIAILVNLLSWLNKKPYAKSNKLTSLIALIMTHLQLVFGLVIYFISPLGLSNFSGEQMKVSISRLYMLEHPLVMLISIVLITIGYSKSKKATLPVAKYKPIVYLYSAGLLLALTRIPWHAWPTVS